MKHAALLIGAATVSLLTAPADARPVTTADLAGKIICSDDGNVQAFSVDGKTANRQFADGRWSVGPNGFEVKANDVRINVDFEIQPDGTYTAEYKDIGGTTHKSAGRACQGKPQKVADLAGKKQCWDGDTVETDLPGGQFSTNDSGDGIYYPNDDGLLSNFTLKWFKYEKIFKGVVQEDLDDGRVLYVGEWPGADFGLVVGEYCK